ncbi:hypothetical protein BFS30_15190 [Pedobacter steynii]|uniref:Uncharacterized protein n=1 Tax=Pedobacter steynii TaxID=430522 RepID=A0A1D7QIA3_9SPHI|nr:hypothetical protein BFS30_15190 [Pedobacter steynii]
MNNIIHIFVLVGFLLNCFTRIVKGSTQSFQSSDRHRGFCFYIRVALLRLGADVSVDFFHLVGLVRFKIGFVVFIFSQ